MFDAHSPARLRNTVIDVEFHCRQPRALGCAAMWDALKPLAAASRIG